MTMKSIGATRRCRTLSSVLFQSSIVKSIEGQFCTIIV